MYINALFRQYNIRFDQIVNGYRHKKEVQGNRSDTLPQKMPTHYRISLHIDDEEAIIQNARTWGFHVLQVLEPDPDWTTKVLDEAERIKKMEEIQANGQK